ncbi:NAD-dependent epimerase/dehydratase family protein [Patescibacteria group bacterium]|nr:NAD-dependent epimerase/dehydratase family protein [Patescibacteria group bacterium]
MKIVVTGGAGFIGSHIVDGLVEKGHQITVIDDLSSGLQENINEKAEFSQLDIANKEAISKLFAENSYDLVVHAAAQKNVRYSVDDPQFDAQVNIIGALNILEACRKNGVGKFIFLSTGGAIYGDTEQRPTEESHPANPISPYGIAKLAVEKYLHYYQVQYQLPYLVLRLANVYGPRQDPKGEAGVVAIFFEKILAGEQPVINGDGQQTRDYVYVGDVVEAVLKGIASSKSGIYNVGRAEEISVNQLFSQIVEISEKDIEEKHGPALPGEQMTSSLSFAKIKNELGWQPTMDLSAGLKLTKKWFQQK